MSRHDKTVLFGHFRPRFFIIVGIIILAVVLLYIYSTGAFRDYQIQLSYYNTSVIGDGVSQVSIPFTIFKGNEEPLTVPIQVQAITNIGSVNTKCSSPSVCNVTFTAPKTARTEYANISINAGGVKEGATQKVKIEVFPDPTKLIILGVGINNISTPAYTTRYPYPQELYLSSNGSIYINDSENLFGWQPLPNDTITVSAFAYDKNNEPVPDGTIINFTDFGLLPNTMQRSCITLNGECTVRYKVASKSQALVIEAKSYNITARLQQNIVIPPLAGFNIIYNVSRLFGTPHSEACNFFYCAYYNYTIQGRYYLIFRVYNELNEPVSNQTVSLLLSYWEGAAPLYSGYTLGSCLTNSNGTCGITAIINASNYFDNETSAYNAANNGYPGEPYGPSIGLEINVGGYAEQINLACGNGISCSSYT
ncbi:MAG: hypothetical protein QXV17_13175 [Candidatus Micrarchaeaceae archaeon]